MQRPREIEMSAFNNSTVAANDTADAVGETRIILSSIFLSVVMLATIFGNSLVIFCVCYYPKLRSRTNYLIVSLAVADWLVGTISLPLRLAQTVNGERWPFSFVSCEFWIWIDMLCSAASILSLTAISFDRLIAVVDPLKYEKRMRQRHVFLMISVIWLFAIVCSSLIFAKWTKYSTILVNPKHPQCSIRSKEYITFVSIAAFFVPLAVVIVNYGVIFRIAIRQAHRLDKETRSLATNYCADSSSTDTNHNSDNGVLKRPIFSFRKDVRKSAKRSATFSLVKQLKATKTLAVVIGVFFVCWFPFFVIFITFQYCTNVCFGPPRMNKKAATVIVIVFVNILPIVNSAANPIIYTCFNADFRKAFARILAKVLYVKRSSDDSNTSFTAVPSAFQKEFEHSSM